MQTWKPGFYSLGFINILTHKMEANSKFAFYVDKWLILEEKNV